MSRSIRSVIALTLSLALSSFGAGCVGEDPSEDELEELEEVDELETELNEEPTLETEPSEQAPSLTGAPDWRRYEGRGPRMCAATPRLTRSLSDPTQKPHVEERTVRRRPDGPGPVLHRVPNLAALSATADEAGELLPTDGFGDDIVPYSLDEEDCEEIPGHIWSGGECLVPCEIEA